MRETIKGGMKMKLIIEITNKLNRR